MLPDYGGDYVQVNCFTTRDAYRNPTAAPGLDSAPRPCRDAPTAAPGLDSAAQGSARTDSLPHFRPPAPGRYLGTVLGVDDSKIINMTVPPPAGLPALSTP